MKRRRLFSLLTALALLAALLPARAAEEVFSIATPQDLARFAQLCTKDTWSQGVTAELTADLELDGSYSLYSKVCEEKSGGETQTPFYVTVAASFVQLYGNNIGGEAAGLVMFDEAFNNMDDERIGGVLEFLRRLPLQIIIAAPPDKIQYISPAMEETLLVMTDEKVSYVEEYYNGTF